MVGTTKSDRYQILEDSSSQERRISFFYRDADYNEETFANDLAVLLVSSIVFVPTEYKESLSFVSSLGGPDRKLEFTSQVDRAFIKKKNVYPLQMIPKKDEKSDVEIKVEDVCTTAGYGYTSKVRGASGR